jgi:hypothetical protein
VISCNCELGSGDNDAFTLWPDSGDKEVRVILDTDVEEWEESGFVKVEFVRCTEMGDFALRAERRRSCEGRSTEKSVDMSICFSKVWLSFVVSFVEFDDISK